MAPTHNKPLPSPVEAPPCLGITLSADLVVTLHDATMWCQPQHRDIFTTPESSALSKPLVSMSDPKATTFSPWWPIRAEECAVGA